MEFRLRITTDNLAFERTPQYELARILRDVADRLDEGKDFSEDTRLFDIFGNQVGWASLKEYNGHYD
jgi:hypothetical protein